MEGFWVAVIVVGVPAVALVWWLSGLTVRQRRAHELYAKTIADQKHDMDELKELYRKNLILTEEGIRLRTEEIGVLRELIETMRTKID